MLKPHLEFVSLDLSQGWSVPLGYPEGIEEKVLCGELSPEAATGCPTRLLRFAPGVYTTAPFVHAFWEEVYLVRGDLTVGNDPQGNGGTPFGPNTYACRPPGAFHGPFKSQGGCMLLEIHYYAKERVVAAA